MSVVLGAMAVIATLFDGPYRRVLESARGGFRSAMALSIFLASWCIAGMVSLVGLTIFHAEKRAMLMANIEKAAAAIRAAQARRSSPE